MIDLRGNGDVRVAVNGRRWVYNPLCLSLAPGETLMEEKTGEEHMLWLEGGHGSYPI